jgi:hypothetical protein
LRPGRGKISGRPRLWQPGNPRHGDFSGSL